MKMGKQKSRSDSSRSKKRLKDSGDGNAMSTLIMAEPLGGSFAITVRPLPCPQPLVDHSRELQIESVGENANGSGNCAAVAEVGEGGFCSNDLKQDAKQEDEESSQDEQIRLEINNAVTNAQNNRRICEERVIKSQGKGLPYPSISELLVEESWLGALQGEFDKPYIKKLCEFVTEESKGSVPIYPPPAQIFNALNSCPLDKVKVVIIGQDPYHGPGQAMGLCFSVPVGVKVPPSLINIYKEIQQDVGCTIPSHGNLEKWVQQGVLLLNAVLTVREHRANSHAKKGWEQLTDATIKVLSHRRPGIVFLLWGSSAQDKTRLIEANGHHILKAAHPSGLSAHRGFFKCRHFSETNKLLEEAGRLPIDWQL
ncbi:hypothetical protein O6H91_17G003200 [Diphasiastrum complanatum]|uniref:Uncharacterized protein n=2 Tax=Diphasiastrum complanatum TaxID=34168 RepID=A0ACC2B3Q1_DIPCM|nr:hypothetical protein O6H91_17G003200 [Diphasiastrum complanatum]